MYSILSYIIGPLQRKLSPLRAKYGVELQKQEIEIVPGRVEVFEGTVQEAVAQAIKMETSFEAIFNDAVATANVNATATVLENSRLECAKEEDWNGCWPLHIEKGVKYLRSVRSRQHLGPGPNKCSRVSCSHDSAIFLCNDVNSIHYPV